MCKIFAMAGIKPDKVQKAWDFVHAMETQFSKGSDNDGIGYAAITAKNELFGERWHKNEEAFRVREVKEESDVLIEKIAKEHLDMLMPLPRPRRYNSFGNRGNWKNACAIIMHARFATSGKGFENTHPFVSDGVALIHNGVIHTPDPKKMKMSSCDSEVILTDYMDNKIYQDPSKIQEVANALDGWYAVAVLNSKLNTGPILDIFRDDGRANLHAAYIEELNTTAYCTSDDYLINAAYACGFKLPVMFKVNDASILRIDAISGKPLVRHEFKVPSKLWNNYRNNHTNNTSNVTRTGEERMKSAMNADNKGNDDKIIAYDEEGNFLKMA